MVHHNHQYIVRGSSGQSLIEVLVAIGIGVLFIVAAVSLIAPALKVNTTANSAQTAGALSKELGDNVRAWAGGSWNNVFSLATSSANQYYLNTLFSPFAAAQGTETITAGSSTYQRYFYVDDVYRDSNGNATSTASGNSYDPSTKKITIVSVPATLGPAISSWPTTTPSSYATQSASAVAYNGYIYETGGEDPQTGDSTSGVIYAPINSNGTVGTWSPTTGMPLGLTLHSAVVYNGYIYTTGGQAALPDGTITSTVQYAPINSNGTVGAWVTTTKMPRSLRGHSAVVYNSYIYTTGGQGNFVGYTSTVQYASINANGTLGSWTSTTALPIGLADHSAVVYKGYIYTTGGEPTTGGFTSTVQYAPINSDGTIGSWTNTTALPNVLIQHSAVVNNGNLYVMGGFADTATSTVHYAPINSNGTVGAWSQTTPLASPLYRLSAVAYNGHIYTTAGYPDTSTVSYASFSTAATFGNAAQQTTSFYLTRNGNNAYFQSDWSGGPGQNGPATSTNNLFSTSTNINYASTTGSISLLQNGAGNSTGGGNIATNLIWRSGTPLPCDDQYHADIANNGYLYNLGGNEGCDNLTTSTVLYAPINATGSIGSWSQTQAMPYAWRNNFATVSNGYVYVPGGEAGTAWPGTITSTVLYAKLNADGSISNWSTTTALPTTLQESGGTSYNGYLYTAGGDNGGGLISTVYYASVNSSTGALGAWSTGQSLPSAIHNAALVAYNGYLYSVGGGVSGSPWVTSTVLYAPINATGSVGVWSLTTALPTGTQSFSEAQAYNGYLFLVGGNLYSGNTSTVLYAPINANGSLGSWSAGPAYPTNVARNGTAVYNGYLYGASGSNAGKNVYYTSLLTTSTLPLVQKSAFFNGGNGLTTSTSAFPSATTAGNLIVVSVAYTSNNSFTCSDSAGNTYVAGPILWDAWTHGIASCYVPNINGGADTITVTFSTSTDDIRVQGFEYRGIATSAPLDASSTQYDNSGNATSGTSGNMTTTASGDLIWSNLLYSHAYTDPLTAGSGFTFRSYNFGANTDVFSTVDMVQSVSGNASATYYGMSGTSSGYYITALAFKTAAAFAASGTLDSTAYDTGITTGAQLNSVLWQGTQPAGTTVQFQFAVSNASSGPWSFIGSDGTGNTFYTATPNTSKQLDYSLFNNYRYFKIRTQLNANAAHTLSPTVNDVIVNWSP